MSLSAYDMTGIIEYDAPVLAIVDIGISFEEEI